MRPRRSAWAYEGSSEATNHTSPTPNGSGGIILVKLPQDEWGKESVVKKKGIFNALYKGQSTSEA